MKTIQWTLLVACLWASSGDLGAQNAKVDSLMHELKTNTTADQAEMLWGVAYELFDVDNAQALFYCRRAYEQALKHGDSLQIVKVGTTFSQLLRRMDRVDESIAVSFSLVPVSKRHNFRKYTKMLLNSLAVGYTFNEEFDKALECHFESLALRKADGEKKEIAIALHNIGLVYYKIGDFELALDYYFQNLMIIENGGFDSEIDFLFSDIGLSYIELGQYEIALDYLSKSLKQAEKTSSRLGIVIAENGMGKCLLHLKNFDEAAVRLQRAHILAVQESNQRFQILSLLLLAEVSIAQNKLDLCDAYLSKAEALPAMKEYNRLRMEIYQQRANLCVKSGEFKQASHYYREFIVLRDIVFGDDMNRGIRRVHTEYAQRENVAEIERQAGLVSLQEGALSQQRWLIFLSSLSAVLTGGLAFVLFRANKQKKRINTILDQRVKERTLTLEKQRDEIRHAHNEQVVAVEWATRELHASLATWRGLSRTASLDLPGEHAIYFKEAEATAEKTARVVQHLMLHA